MCILISKNDNKAINVVAFYGIICGATSGFNIQTISCRNLLFPIIDVLYLCFGLIDPYNIN